MLQYFRGNPATANLASPKAQPKAIARFVSVLLSCCTCGTVAMMQLSLLILTLRITSSVACGISMDRFALATRPLKCVLGGNIQHGVHPCGDPSMPDLLEPCNAALDVRLEAKDEMASQPSALIQWTLLSYVGKSWDKQQAQELTATRTSLSRGSLPQLLLRYAYDLGGFVLIQQHQKHP